MDIRYSANQKDFQRYNTEETRKEFLVSGLYKADEVVSVYSHVDRMVTLGCMPVNEIVPIEKGMDVWANFGTKFFLERRELGMFNIGGAGAVTVDGTHYDLDYKDCLYVTRGSEKITFESADKSNPAKFYMISAPAHRAYTTKLITIADAASNPIGAAETANKRVIYQFIHPAVLETCQLMMGLTSLDVGNVWNTMPVHTHERIMEIYTYFEISDDDVVFHLMGEPSQTRHIVIRNEEAVISPSWSIHSGCGTSNYSFIWAMGGENQEFNDMDTIAMPELG
jgi:4-deoxy-L-threo-5-hexosulose-uronate ketol-isomerase